MMKKGKQKAMIAFILVVMICSVYAATPSATSANAESDFSPNFVGGYKDVTQYPKEFAEFAKNRYRGTTIEFEDGAKNVEYKDGQLINNGASADLNKLGSSKVKIIALKSGGFKVDLGENKNVEIGEGANVEYFLGKLTNNGVTIDLSKFSSEDNIETLKDSGFSVNGIRYTGLKDAKYEISPHGLTLNQDTAFDFSSSANVAVTKATDESGDIMITGSGKIAAPYATIELDSDGKLAVHKDSSYTVSGAYVESESGLKFTTTSTDPIVFNKDGALSGEKVHDGTYSQKDFETTVGNVGVRATPPASEKNPESTVTISMNHDSDVKLLGQSMTLGPVQVFSETGTVKNLNEYIATSNCPVSIQNIDHGRDKLELYLKNNRIAEFRKTFIDADKQLMLTPAQELGTAGEIFSSQLTIEKKFGDFELKAGPFEEIGSVKYSGAVGELPITMAVTKDGAAVHITNPNKKGGLQITGTAIYKDCLTVGLLCNKRW